MTEHQHQQIQARLDAREVQFRLASNTEPLLRALAVAPLKIDDGGRSQSKRSRQKNDCTVRALAILTGLAYDDVYDHLAALGRKCSRGWTLSCYLRAHGQILGWQARWVSFPATAGMRRATPAWFCQHHPRGRWLLRQAKHVAAVIEGVVHDTFASDGRCVYGAWEFTRISGPTGKPAGAATVVIVAKRAKPVRLAGLRRDPRVAEVQDLRSTYEGVWVWLRTGWVAGDMHAFMGETTEDLNRTMQTVVRCTTPDCHYCTEED